MATAFTIPCLLAIQETPTTITTVITRVGSTKQVPIPTKASATAGVISMGMANTFTAASISTTAAGHLQDLALTPLLDQVTALASFQAAPTSIFMNPIALRSGLSTFVCLHSFANQLRSYCLPQKTKPLTAKAGRGFDVERP